MVFWIIAAAILAVATLITCYPLFREKTGWTPIALACVFALPAAALFMYQQVGTPEAIGLSGIPQDRTHTGTEAADGEIDDLIVNLRSRLDESPESLEGWVLLARTLKTMQRFPEALEALQTAKRIAPDDPFVAVELVEAQLFMSQGGRISDEMISELQRALDQDPGQQKALWLMGVAASQAGEDEAAITYWETLLEQVEPDNPIRASVEEQITAARMRMGDDVDSVSMMPAQQPAPESESASDESSAPSPETTTAEATPPPAPETDASQAGPWTGLDVNVVAAAEMPQGAPQQGVLFVMIRPPGMAMGPPIGVRRVIGPTLPLTLTLSDRDSMIQERQISSEAQVQIQARLSLSGSPAARPGDWQSEPVVVDLQNSETVELLINQRVE